MYGPRACLLDNYGLMASEWAPVTFGEVRPGDGVLEIPVSAMRFAPLRKCYANAVRIEWGTWRMDVELAEPQKADPKGTVSTDGFSIQSSAPAA